MAFFKKFLKKPKGKSMKVSNLKNGAHKFKDKKRIVLWWKKTEEKTMPKIHTVQERKHPGKSTKEYSKLGKNKQIDGKEQDEIEEESVKKSEDESDWDEKE